MVVAKKKEEEPEPYELSGSSVELTLLDHHVVEVLVVGDGDEGVEIFVGELVSRRRRSGCRRGRRAWRRKRRA
ncbi:unnamed protein product [Prunus armeniaca]|uniref:Uncharacterized protein n=1 Tax=Prunus armeniaca TaxID=36596 RepID=A0A6J5UBF6_PRUAR|nr:unnamed protein product [Prunus armeniaca]